jgi:hypothetical protein
VVKPKTEVHSFSLVELVILALEMGVTYLRKSSMVWIWQHDKMRVDYKIILNYARKWMKNKSEKETGKGDTWY